MASGVKGILYSLLPALIVAIGTFSAGVAATLVLSEATHSGLFGICGPYGETWSVSVQLAFLGAAFLGSPVLATITFMLRRKRANTSVAA